jgi:uncharacterized membrane protein SpoIIM required for sporulation
MKDKLEKTGHKKLYYRLKAFLTVVLFALAVFALGAIPVGISFKLAEAQAQADSENSQRNSSSNPEELGLQELPSNF